MERMTSEILDGELTIADVVRRWGKLQLADGFTSMEHLAEMLWESAIGGDMRAAKMVLEYSIGRPQTYSEPVDKAEIGEEYEKALERVYGNGDGPGSENDEWDISHLLDWSKVDE